MNKTPDTRNKLDSNKGIKKGKRQESKYSMSEFKEVASIVKLGVTPTGRKPKKLTPAQQFKLDHGYSKTIAKLMKKYFCKTLEEYRELRRERKLAAKKAKKRIVPSKVEIKPSKSKPTKNKK